jgi:uncharacterized protein YjiS (DUF1127 family)
MIAVLPSRRPEQASLASIVSALRLVGHEVDFVAIRIFDGVARWHARMHERATLATLDERMRKDIGVTHTDIAREAGKPFWQP